MSEVIDDIDLSDTCIPKTDQLNFDCLISGPRTITITGVKKVSNPEQPTIIYYEGDDGRPYKPSKGMRRLLQDKRAWGSKGREYIGRKITVYGEPSITYGGKAVGGIRISHLSDIKEDFTFGLRLNKQQKIDLKIKAIHIIPLKQITDAELKAFTIEFDGAKTDADLKKVGAKIAGAGYDDEGTAKLKALYRDASKKLRETK